MALIGVYYLGKHSSSLNVRGSKGEKRYLRRPFSDNLTGAVVDRPSYNDNLAVGYRRGQNKVLEKIPNGEAQSVSQVGVENGQRLSTTKRASKVTPPAPAKKANQQTKHSGAIQSKEQNKVNKQYEDGADNFQDANKINDDSANKINDDITIQTPTQSSVSQTIIVSTIRQTDKSLAFADKPKPTVIFPEVRRTSKLTALQKKISPPQSVKLNRNSKANTNDSSLQNLKGVKTDKADHQLQDLLKDKDLFGFVGKNITDQMQHTNILKTASYTKLLQYQISKRTKPPTPPSADDRLLYKNGYSKATSDKIPLLRNVPDNRNSRYVICDWEMQNSTI